MDLSNNELRRAHHTASIVKLQSLLDLALNTDAHGEDLLFREDVKVTMAKDGLYDFLMKVVSVSGIIGGEDGDLDGSNNKEEPSKKDKDDKKSMLGEPALMSLIYALTPFCISYRRLYPGLYCQIPALTRDFPQDHLALSATLPIPAAPEACRAVPFSHVDRAENLTLATSRPQASGV